MAPRPLWDFGAEYQFDIGDYDDSTLSFDRHRVAVDVQRELNADWTVQAGLEHDRSSYDSSTGSEERTELIVAVSRDLGKSWRAVVRYAYADNQADLPEFDYRRTRVSAGVEASW